MPALHRLTVKNFRNLRDVELELGDLNVLVGPNGAGKSNLLAVLAFLGDCVRLDLPQAVSRQGGVERLAFRSAGHPFTVSIEVEARAVDAGAALDAYGLSFAPRSSRRLRRAEWFRFERAGAPVRQIVVAGERFTVQDGEGEPVESALDDEALGLAILPKLGPQQGARQVAALGELFSTFRVFDVDVREARRPSAVAQADRLEPDASNLAAFLAFLQSEHPELFGLLVEDMTRIMPGFVALHLVPVGGAGRGMSVEIEERGIAGRTLLAEASLGTIRALALLAMLHDPNPPKLTCVEEIDHGLHPYALDLIVDRMRMASQYTQLLVATHSPTLVNRLTASELIVCERDPETGEALIPAIEPALVEEMEAVARKRVRRIGLGELWFSGTLGGVPR